jgi:uncharacterized protein with PIN domain
MNKHQRYRLKDVEGYRSRKAAYARTPEQRKHRVAYMRGWRLRNLEHNNKLARESHERNKHKHIERNRNRALLREYGITTYQKLEMIEAQNGRCAICNNEFVDSRRTHVDHCHETKAIRGILCVSCNTRLGWYEKHRTSIRQYMKET